MKKKKQIVHDPESTAGWKTASIKEATADSVVEGGFSITFIVGAVLALFVILGYPFFLMGKWLYNAVIALGFTQITALYAIAIIGVAYLLSILVFCIISRKSKVLKKRKNAKIFVRITAVILPSLTVGIHLWRYFLAYTEEKNIPINLLNAVVISIFPILIGLLFWKLTSRYLLPGSK